MEKVLIIYYQHNWGGAFTDRKWWTSHFEGESDVWDYGTRRQIEQRAKNEGLKFKTLRHHKNGKTSVLASNF